MNPEAIATLALIASIGALVLACRAYQYARAAHDLTNRVCAIMESRSSRTVVCDLSDGRITVIKELKDVG